jgi:hypothetical protein
MRSLSVKYGEKYHYIAHLDVPMGCKTYGMMTKNDDNFIPFIIKKSTFQSENIKTKFVGLTATVLLFVFCLLLGGKAFGQNAFTIGSGTSTYYTPLPGWYGWQYDVYLYTPSDAAELNNDIILTSIAYDITNINSSTSVAEWNIWIKDVDASYTLSSTTTFSTFKSGAQLVYSSTTETITTTGWKTLNFSSGFNHEAGKAILVMVFGKGCTTSGGCARQCRYTEVQNSMWRNNVDSSTDPGTERTGTLDRYRANVKFTYTPPTVCEDFNSTSGSGSYSTGGVLPSGWNRIYAGTVYGNTETSPANMPHVTTSSNTTPGAPNSSNYICFYSSGSASEYSYAIMPAVPAGKAVSHLSFRYNFESAAYGTLTYGVINGTDANSYQVIGTVSNPSTNPGHIDIDLAVGATTGKRIAFRWYKTSTWYTCGIDDVCISTVSVAPTNYTVSVSANPSAGGTVSGGGTFSSGASCTVSATTNTCYTFSGWYENGSRVSTSASYTFTVSGNRTLEARYTQNTHTVSVSANPSAGGSVSGGGTKNCGTSTTVTATTNTCYTFDGWYENGSRVSTNASYTFTVSSNRTLEARYTQNTHTVSVSANPSAGGTVSGGGTFNCGTSPTVTATPNSGYHFVNWTEGGSQVSTSASYTISSISANHTLVANFEANSSGGDCAEVQIGSGTAVHNYLPTYIFYNYSLTQQIYTDDEIGNEAGDIVSVSFYAKAAMTRNLNVYMVATNKESFTGTNDWINVSASDLVFSGSVTFDADAWTTIALDNPFSYDGRQNVALIVDDNTGSYVSSVNSLVFDGTNQTIRIYSDGTNYDPESATSYTGTIMNVKNQIKFCIVPAVSVPDDFCVDFESGSMPVGWTSEGSGSAYWSVGIGDSNTSTGANTGSYNARITHSTSGNVTYLVSPEMDLSNVSSASLTFSYVNRSWAGDIDEFAVCYRVNGGTWTELFSTASAHSSWTEQSVTLTGFAANYQIGFKYTDRYGYGVGLDDICFNFEGGGAASCGIIVYYDDFGGNDVQDERYAGPHKLADPEHNYTSGGGIIPAEWTHAGDYTRCNYINHYQYTSSQDFGDCRHHGSSNCTSNYTKVYAINKNTYHDASSNGWIMNKSDHTFADDVTRGYMFQGDGTGDFYVKTITDVPAGDYRLSAWFMDVSSGGKCSLSVSGTTVSGSPTSGEQLLGSQGEWVQRYCDFTLTAQGSITITLYGSDDFACDDILVASRNNAPPTISMSLDHDCNEYPMVECLTYHYGTGDYNDGDGFSFTAQNENGCENTVERDATWRYYHIYYDYGINCNGESDYEVQDVPMWSCNPATVNVRPPVACSNKCFMRWATRANGGGSSYLPGDEITVGSNIYLYAIYDVCPNPCSDVTVMTCGQTYSGTLGRIGAWDSYPNVSDWTYDEVGEEKVYSFTPAVTGTYSFYGTTNDGDADFFLLSSCDNEGTEITHWDDAVFDDVSVSLSAETTYYLIVDNYYGTSTSEYEVYVSLSSIANVTASASIVCNGSQVTLTAPSGGTTYTWTPSGSGSSAVVTPTVTANTTYRVTVWSGSSCSASSSVLVNVYNTITATASASRANYCQSETPSLTASVTSSNNNSPVTYQWYTAANAGNAISGATSATYTGGSRTAGSHTYYVRVSDGCTTTDFIRVDYNVYNTITATASPSRANYCQSETPSLTASVTSSNNNSPVTYQWYTAANAGSAISGATSATYTGGSRTAGNHTYYVRVSDGCTTTDFIRVDYNVYNTITATASASRANYCQSETPSLTASVTSSNNNSPVTYQWYTAANAGNAISGATSATYTGGSRTAGSHTYYVRVSDGCTTTDFIRVDYSVYGDLVSSAIANANDYCLNATATALSTTPSSGSGSYNYQWQYSTNGSTWNNTGSNSSSFTPPTTSTGTIYYRVIVSDNCSSVTMSSVQITVNDKPAVSAISAPDAICVGESLDLTAPTVIQNGSSILAEGWEISPSQNGTYTPFTNSNIQQELDGYYIRYSATNGCGTTANAGVQITVNHPDISITSTCDYVWRGGTSNWNIASNWYEYNNGTYSIASELPSEAKNYYIAIGGSGTCLQDVQQAYMNSDATVNNIEIAPGAELHIMENVTLRLAGSIINNGTFVADNTSIIELNGANDQTLSSAMEFGNVTFAQVVDGKKIFAPHGITVNGVATFTKGVIVGDMNFVSGATASEASLLSHVDGAVTKAFGSSAFTFPTGNGHTLGTIAVPATRSGGSATVRYRNVAGTNDLPSDYPRWWNANDNCDGNDPQFDHVSNIEFWNVSSNVALNNVTLMVSSAEVTDHFGAGATSYDDEDIFGAMWLGSCWKNIGGPGTVENGNTKISVNVSIRATRSSSNHYVSLGSKTPSTLLPIELVSFNAICDGKSVLVDWATATERNNDYFVIERSDDAINFTEIARVAGAGNSIEPIDYSYTDYGFHGGDNYYRLVQVDYDGSRTVSEIIVATCEEPEVGEPDVQAYPNPFNGELTLVLDNFENRPARIEVYDMLGKLIMFEKVDAPQNSYETILNLYNLPPAAYNVRVSTTDFVINSQVVKN